MSLESELEPKLAEIDRVAKQRYEIFLDNRGFVVVPGTTQLDFNEVVKGNVDPIWEVGMVVPNPDEEDLANEQTAYNDFLQQLADLLAKFRTFYSLGDPFDFTTMSTKLGANTVTTFPGGEEGALSQGPQNFPVAPYFPLIPSPPTVLERLQSAYDDNMQYVDGLITERQWTGSAATTFQADFLGPFHKALLWQWGYVRELGIAVQTYHEAITKGIEDVKAIADMCIAEMQPGGEEPTARELAVVSLISGAIALIPPLSIPAGLYALGTGLWSYLKDESEAEEKECQVTITGGPVSMPAVVGSTWDALITLEGCLSGTDDRLASGLGKDYANENAFASPDLVLPRPDLANRADEEAPLGELKFVSRPGQDAVVVELRELYRAGYANLPGAAGLYGEAGTAVNECLIPGALNQFFPRSIPIFNDSRDLLAQIFQQISDSLTDAGRALVNTAQNYELTDTENRQLLDAIGEIDPWETQPES
jgi:hypothetical protein